MAKLNQIVAVVNGKKTETQKSLTALHRTSSKTEDFNGLTRRYRSLDEENGETFPDENKPVLRSTDQSLTEVQDILTGLFDVVATQDYNNSEAKADIVVNGATILSQVPVTYLLFLEKQMNDLAKFVESLPTLDPSETWLFDENKALFVSQTKESNKTKKTLRHKVLYEATKEHPAQIEKWNEDVTVGKWETTKLSGAMPVTKKLEISNRIKQLQEAIKFAREEANSVEVSQTHVGEDIFNFLFQ